MSRLDHPGFHQAAQGCEPFRQIPTGQRGGLIKGACLLLQQGQVVNRIKDHVFAIPAPWVAGNHLSTAANDDLIHIATKPDIKLHLAKPNAAGCP
mgnify:CR=1 FL=1